MARPLDSRVGVWALVVILAVLSARRVPTYADNLTLWSAAITIAPTKPRVLINYGAELVIANRLNDAQAAFTRARAQTFLPTVRPEEYRRLRAVANQNIVTLLSLNPTPEHQQQIAVLMDEAYRADPKIFERTRYIVSVPYRRPDDLP
jgi:hypothetical protein